jgi:chromate reductase
MDKTRNVAVIVGSLRKDSINRKVGNALVELTPKGLKLSLVEIGQLPLYNQDLDDKPPPEWTAFRDRIRVADAVLFVTPEYNRSVPAPLKNAIDDPKDIAALVLFLTSDAGKSISGQVLPIDNDAQTSA